jgi:hypothetical protein
LKGGESFGKENSRWGREVLGFILELFALAFFPFRSGGRKELSGKIMLV